MTDAENEKKEEQANVMTINSLHELPGYAGLEDAVSEGMPNTKLCDTYCNAEPDGSTNADVRTAGTSDQQRK